jgi:hypothetical protein
MLKGADYGIATSKSIWAKCHVESVPLAILADKRRAEVVRASDAGVDTDIAGVQHGAGGVQHGVGGAQHGVGGVQHGVGGVQHGVGGVDSTDGSKRVALGRQTDSFPTRASPQGLEQSTAGLASAAGSQPAALRS